MENKNSLKEAFSKVKDDINFLNNEILNLKILLNEIKTQINPSTHNSTDRHKNTTNSVNSTHNSTVRQEIEGLKPLNLTFSTGNEGVSTDRQTDNQTDNSTDISPENLNSNMQKVSEALNSLDNLKKEIRLKFKHITNQEMLVFSTIYQFEEQEISEITYKMIAKHLRLSESSIRDYVQRMINKGIPILKTKQNNKKVILSISDKLKKIATLSNIINLREL